MITLYRKNRLGVGSWKIWNESNTIVIAHTSTVGGSEIFHSEIVPCGLAGRSLEEQIASRIDSRVNHQRDKGYVDSLEQAMNSPLTNTLGMPPPMLAIKLRDMRGFPNVGYAQVKFDGFRCLVTRDNSGQILCYSRQGKVLTALQHLAKAFESTLPEDVVLDGEIYQHGQSLQSIASLAKRLQLGTENLVYNVYDSVGTASFIDRWHSAREIVEEAANPNVKIVNNTIVTCEDQLWDCFAKFRANGYEGAMLRIDGPGYESGSRSRSLVKVKAREDGEFVVQDIIEDANGCGVLICKLDNGRTFRTSAPGTHSEKRHAFMNSPEYIGRKVSVEYANLTSDGIPFHAVATRWHEAI